MEPVLKNENIVFSFDKTYTIEEYLLIEGQSVEKHELLYGKVYKMPGAKPAHNLIAANIIRHLGNALEGASKEYFVLTGDTKIFIPRFGNIVYPDAVVVCEHIELLPGSTTVITNPLLIVEVLSPSTEKHDREGKFYDYKQIPSFKEYLLVEQTMPYIVSSFKMAERTWQDTEAEGLDATIYLKSIDCTLALNKIYKGERFENPKSDGNK
jgi:Uma2 family endonuclease